MNKVYIKDLTIGMFVEELAIPWLETPFLLQGMLIESQDDIESLGKYCDYVYVASQKEAFKEPSPKPYSTHVIPDDKGKKTQFHGDHVYVETSTFEQEIPVAKKSYIQATKLISQIKADIDKNHKLDLNTAKELVNVIASSIIKNPAAMLFVNQFNSLSNSNNYEHALNTSIHMISFGRHLCLPATELYVLGLGGLLMDIGQLKVSEALEQNQDSLSLHVIEGEKILLQIPSIPEEVIQITTQHHERENGKGYPLGLGSNQITTYARMAAIVDIYEDLVTQGPQNDKTLTPFKALKTLWDMTRTGLNAILVQQFAHCIGLFPCGSLVKLNTGEIAIVVAQNRSNRLLPKLIIVLDKDKKTYSTPFIVDLADEESNADSRYEITQDLKPGAYGVDPQEYYL